MYTIYIQCALTRAWFKRGSFQCLDNALKAVENNYSSFTHIIELRA